MSKMVILLLGIWVIAAGEVVAQVGTQDPKTARDFYKRGLNHENAKRYDAALADYKKAGDLDPQFFDAHFTRSSLLALRKDHRAAIQSLTDSLKARPNDSSALFNRGLYHEYLHEYDDAIADYTSALSEKADFSHFGGSTNEARAHAYHYRGRVHQWYKHDDFKAIADYTNAIRLDPEIRRVRYRRGQAYHGVGDYAKAHEDYEQAAKQRPDYPNLLNSWAWQLATCPDSEYRDGKLALRLAMKTNDLDTLAAAYAEVGEFDDAVAAQQRAIDELERKPERKTQKAIDRREELKTKMQERLAAYVAKQPHREP